VQDTAKELAGDRGVVAGQIEVAGGLPGEQLLLADLQRHHDHVEEEGRRQLALPVKITHKQSRDILCYNLLYSKSYIVKRPPS